MPLSLKIFTLNCGNDTPGTTAVQQLAQEISNVDVIILHCQEVDFDKTYRQLREQFDKEIEIDFAEKMVTHTKLDTQFHHQTGMATILIRKPQVDIVHSKTQVVRREEGRTGSGYNKGGTYTNLSLRKKGEKDPYQLSLVNAHLDAFREDARAQDWLNLHKVRKFNAHDWDDLCRKTPDMVANGYDANTRNYLQNQGEETISRNPWEFKAQPGMQELIMAPLGNRQESSLSTYKNNQKDMPSVADKKRWGFAKGGMLDIVSVNDAELAKVQLHYRDEAYEIDPVTLAALQINPNEDSARDHSVIGSHPVFIEKQSDFLKVRDYLASSLVYAAPEIAEYILQKDFIDTAENRSYLFRLHEYYLSPQGLMQTQLQLHQEKLALWNQFKSWPAAEEIKQQLFRNSTWFACEGVLPKDRSSLDLAAISHANRQALETLQVRFLKTASTDQQRLDILRMIDNAMLALPDNNKPQTLIKNTETLLTFNHLTHQYKAHLLNECTDKDELSNKNPSLLRAKLKAVNQLRDASLQKPEAGALDHLGKALNDNVWTLSQHRHQDIFHKIYRKLQELISHYIPKTQGQIFAEKAKLVLNQERISMDTGIPESRKTTLP